MRKTFIQYSKKALLVSALCLATFGIVLTSCDDDDDGMGSEIVLESYGPMPIARGAELSFIGHNLDQVTAIVLPSNIEMTDFGTKSSALITLTVPQNATEGLVVLKTPNVDITTKTEIGYLEPISIESFSPTSIKAGQELTIKGDYLNLIKEIIFTDRVAIGDTSFTSQSRTEIKLLVPAKAQTGKIAISNGAEDPVIIYSEAELEVILPAFAAINPNPVKAGEQLTITGTNLDLVKAVKLGGEKTISEFISQSETKIELAVPDDTQDGNVSLVPASMVSVESETELILVVPTVSVTPVSLKNGEEITVTGTNLDLIDKIIFGGDKEGTKVDGGTDTEMKVLVPDEAVSGVVRFTTLANKEVNGPEITLTDPVFTSFAPIETKANTDITIEGSDLDLVVEVMFTGDLMGTIVSQSETQLLVTVPVGSQTGLITLITKNGSQISSPSEITITTNLPEITGFAEAKGVPGEILTIQGTKLLLIKELIFPGNVKATAYGSKTDEMVEVYIPMDVQKGVGTITMITYEGEQGLTPEIFIGGTDPVVDPALMIVDCENADIPGDWGGNIEVANDPDYALSGNYIHGTATALSGWAWIWGNNWWAFPSVSKADHLFKMDVFVAKPFGASNVHFEMEFGGSRIDIGAFGITSPSETTTGWVTVTYDLAEFSSLPDNISSSGEWGISFNSADGPVDISGLYIDNIRFEAK